MFAMSHAGGPPVPYEPIHTQHHEGKHQKHGETHKTLREAADLSGPFFRSGRYLPLPARTVGGGPERGSAISCVSGLGLPDRILR